MFHQTEENEQILNDKYNVNLAKLTSPNNADLCLPTYVSQPRSLVCMDLEETESNEIRLCLVGREDMFM